MKPTITITEDFVAAHGQNITAQCTHEKFTAEFRGEQIEVPVEKLNMDSSDPFINLMAGLTWIIDLKM